MRRPKYADKFKKNVKGLHRGFWGPRVLHSLSWTRQFASVHKPFDPSRWLAIFLLEAEMLVFGKVNNLYLFGFLLHSTVECLTHYLVLLWHTCGVGRAVDKTAWCELNGPQQVIRLRRWAWLQVFFFPEPPCKSSCGRSWRFSLHICSGGERKEEHWALSGFKQEASKSSAYESCKQFCFTCREYGPVILKTRAHNFHDARWQ